MQHIPHGMWCTFWLLLERKSKGGGQSFKVAVEKGQSVNFLVSVAPMRLETQGVIAQRVYPTAPGYNPPPPTSSTFT